MSDPYRVVPSPPPLSALEEAHRELALAKATLFRQVARGVEYANALAPHESAQSFERRVLALEKFLIAVRSLP